MIKHEFRAKIYGCVLFPGFVKNCRHTGCTVTHYHNKEEKKCCLGHQKRANLQKAGISILKMGTTQRYDRSMYRLDLESASKRTSGRVAFESPSVTCDNVEWGDALGYSQSGETICGSIHLSSRAYSPIDIHDLGGVE